MSPTRCACGHVIRWMYPWKHKDGRSLITGSVCVDNLPGINAETVRMMREALERLLAERKEAERKAHAAEQDAHVAALREELRAKIYAKWGGVIEARREGRWLEPSRYNAYCTAEWYLGELARAKRLKSARGKIDCLTQALNELNKYEVA
jgi:hypothetical protein